MEDWYKKADGRDAHTSYTQAQSLDGLVQKNISSASENIVTNSTYKSQATQGEYAMEMLRQEYKEKDIDKEKEFNRDKINRFGGKKK